MGTIGWGHDTANGFEVTRPWLRGGNADLNMTFAMAMIFMVLWLIWALQSNGIAGFLLHIFGPKGESQGAMKYAMIVVFFAVGFIEVMSIAFRPISLSFRLFGNMFAGENLLDAMSHVIRQPAWAKAVFSVVLPIPFYLMELLVGFVQAIVFMLLTAVFTAVICMHEEAAHGQGASLRCLKFRRLDRIQLRGPPDKKKQAKKGNYGNAYVGRNGRQHSRRFGRFGFGHWRGIGRHESFRSGGTQSRRLRQDHHDRFDWHGILRSHRVLRALPGRSNNLAGAGPRSAPASFNDL